MSLHDAEAYVGQANVPSFLLPVAAMPLFSPVDPAARKYAHDEKYQHYFNKLSLSPMDALAQDGKQLPSASDEAYMAKHQVWRPNVKFQDEESAGASTNTRSLFSAFVNIPTVFTDLQLTGLSYHTSVQMPDGVHIYGGMHALDNDKYIEKLKSITKNFTIPPENIKLVFDYDLPLPLEKDKFASIAHEPFKTHARYDPGCNSVQTLIDLSVFEESPDEINSASSTQFSGLSGMRAPKPLCCASAAKLSERFYVLYGGFDLVEEISYPDESHCVIEKKVVVNDQVWVFDCLSLKYKEIKLSVHPTYASVFPNSIPRFGHCMTAVAIEETNCGADVSQADDKNDAGTAPADVLSNNSPAVSEFNRSEVNKTPATSSTHVTVGTGYSPQDVREELKRNYHRYSNRRFSADRSKRLFEKPAILFVMGGYSSVGTTNSFVAVNDLWKCEIFLDNFGVSDEIVCCPIGSFDLLGNTSFVINQNGVSLPPTLNDDKYSGIFHHLESNGTEWPAPRGFFTMILIDKNGIGKHFMNEIDSTTPPQPPHTIISPTPSRASALFNESRSKQNNPSFGSPLKSPPSMRQSMMKAKNGGGSPVSITPSRYSIYEGQTPQRTSPVSTENSTDRVTSSSPYSDLGIHTSMMPELSSKILVCHAGSSIMYTKVVDENTGEETTFYNKRILGDCWWFNFATEKWHFHETYYKGAPMNLKICGHLINPGEETINVFGGLQERHYKDETYRAILHKLHGPDSELDPQIYEVAKNFVENVRVKQYAKSNQSIEEFERSAGLNHAFLTGRQYPTGTAQCYTTYLLDIPKKEWRLVDYAYVKDLRLAKVWESGDPLCSGGVGLSEKQYYNDINDSPYFLIYTCSFAGLYDSRLVVLINDAHLMDKKTDKHADARQCIWGNGITEVYSSYLAL